MTSSEVVSSSSSSNTVRWNSATLNMESPCGNEKDDLDYYDRMHRASEYAMQLVLSRTTKQKALNSLKMLLKYIKSEHLLMLLKHVTSKRMKKEIVLEFHRQKKLNHNNDVKALQTIDTYGWKRTRVTTVEQLVEMGYLFSRKAAADLIGISGRFRMRTLDAVCHSFLFRLDRNVLLSFATEESTKKALEVVGAAQQRAMEKVDVKCEQWPPSPLHAAPVPKEKLLAEKKRKREQKKQQEQKKGTCTKRSCIDPPSVPQRMEKDESLLICRICLEKDRTHATNTCNHFCFCEMCVDTIVKKGVEKICPVCRTPYEYFIRVYL